MLCWMIVVVLLIETYSISQISGGTNGHWALGIGHRAYLTFLRTAILEQINFKVVVYFWFETVDLLPKSSLYKPQISAHSRR